VTVVTALDLRGLQRFVFASRRLLDAIGRSALIADLTDPTNITLKRLLTDYHAQVVTAGAGGLTVASPTSQAAQSFTAAYTRWVHDLSDALSVVCAQMNEDAGPDQPHRIAHALLRARACSDTGHTPALSSGFTATCAITGAPAEVVSRAPGEVVPGETRAVELLAADVHQARARARDWHTTQQQSLAAGLHAPNGAVAGPDTAGPAWSLTTELDRLANDAGEFSHLAVIHLDINGLGHTLHDHATANPDSAIAALAEASEAIAAIVNALAARLCSAIAEHAVYDPCTKDTHVSGFPGRLRVRVHPNEPSGWVLPLRPVITAGDDLTIVCDARLAWSLARAATTWLHAPIAALDASDPRRILHSLGPAFQTSDRARVGLTLGVGIATFRVGSPLAAAYDRAAALTQFAKTHRPGAQDSIAWDTTGRAPEMLIDDLTGRRQRGLTAQPYTTFGFDILLSDYLGSDEPSLRSHIWAPQRTWVKSTLIPLLLDQDIPTLRLELERRRDAGLPTALPGNPAPFGPTSSGPADDSTPAWLAPLLDAAGLLDWHLDLTGTASPDQETKPS
jgi:hypothetical protein